MNVVSLFDYTGIACVPWAKAGYDCFCFDLQHDRVRKIHVGLGTITYVPWNSDKSDWLGNIEYYVATAWFVMSFAPCDDLAGSGSKHWVGKALKDPDFQIKAAARFAKVETVAKKLGCDRWVAENPVGAVTRLWRKFNYTVHPCWYGGYISEAEAEHPTWPEYIAPRDAYEKRTCLWTGPEFVLPPRRDVEPESFSGESATKGKKLKFNRQTKKLGGKSLKTKNIRSATPRGLFRAIFLHNKKS